MAGLNSRIGDEDLSTYSVKSGDQLNAELADHTIKGAQKVVHEAEQLTERLKEARAALDDVCKLWNPQWIDVVDRQGKMLEDLRSWRMAVTTEAKHITRELTDLRKFFLGEDHAREMAILHEFVDVCERLQRLKDNGFLDKITDTILKLSV